MTRMEVINLIKYHVEKNDRAFRDQAYEIAVGFTREGKEDLSSYIMSLLSAHNTFSVQDMDNDYEFLYLLEPSSEPLPLPQSIADDIKGIMNAISNRAGVNKFLFAGAPGTGKTESARHLARLLDRKLYSVDFSLLIDSRLGQSQKNIAALFNEINNMSYPGKTIILFDEIDSIAMDRLNKYDLREMGRTTSAVLKGFDSLNEDTVIIATTNLHESFDKAFIRRFDKVIDFSRYTREDLMEVADSILRIQLQKVPSAGRNSRLFHKIISMMDPIPYPGDLRNLIRSSIAFSSPDNEFDYLRRLFHSSFPSFPEDVKAYKEKGFTTRETEILTGISRSTVSRELGDK